MGDEATAILSKDGARVVGVMTRSLQHPPAEVWRMLTEPAKLPEWLAPGRIELAVGGAVRLDFEGSGTVIDSKVSAYQEGRVLEYSWSAAGEPERPIRWQVAPDAAGARLTLTVTTPAGEDPGRACAGWEAHLQMLEAALEGAPIKFPFERFRAARDAYREKIAALS